jgi:hypothetical protein
MNNTLVKTLKPKGSNMGEKYCDGGDLFLNEKKSGNYWRMNSRSLGKYKAL